MTPRNLVSCLTTAVVFAACSGGGSGSSASPQSATPQSVMVHVIADSPTKPTSSVKANATMRKPLYVSPATTAGSVYIDSGPAQALSCTLTVCTGNFSVAIGSHTFAVELDDGTSYLSEGSSTATVTIGSNSVTVPLKGIAVQGSFQNTFAPLAPGGSGTVNAIADADGNTIDTSESAFDNGPIVIKSSDTSIATVSATIATPGTTYAYTVTCVTAGLFTVYLTTGARTSPFGTGGEFTSKSYPATGATLTGSTYPTAYLQCSGAAGTASPYEGLGGS